MTLNEKTKRPRKPGSGRKRKIGAITSEDYAQQLEKLEKREAQWINMTPQQREALKKEKRSLRNRMSALRSRENKRTKVERLENAVQRLRREIQVLKRENCTLRQSTSPAETTVDTPRRKRRPLSSYTAPAKENVHSLPTPPPLLSNYSSTQKMSTPVEPCTHNCGSALGDATDDFAFDIFSALDNFEDFGSVTDDEALFPRDSDLPTDATCFETDFLEDFDFVPPL